MPDPTASPVVPPVVPPVVKEAVVAAPIDTCFKTFVDGFNTWWPREHHIGEDRSIVEFVLEPTVGGRAYDIDSDGGQCHWGTVLVHEPLTRLVLAWHIQADFKTIDLDPARQSEVEVSFAALGREKTAVRLEHRHIGRHGPGAERLRGAVDSPGGWPILLARFADAVEGRPPRPLPAPPQAGRPQPPSQP